MYANCTIADRLPREAALAAPLDLETELYRATARDLAGQLKTHREALLRFGAHRPGCPGEEACQCGWSQIRRRLLLGSSVR